MGDADRRANQRRRRCHRELADSDRRAGECAASDTREPFFVGVDRLLGSGRRTRVRVGTKPCSIGCGRSFFNRAKRSADATFFNTTSTSAFAGPDFLWAALGPALEAYSAHSFVKKQAGGTMSVDEFLQQVRRLVLQFSLGELPGFRDVSRETSGRGEALDLDPVTQYYLLHRAFFGLEPAPSGACILYANGCGLNETALRLVWQVLEQGGSRTKSSTGEDETGVDEEDESKGQYRLVDWRARAQRDGLGESRAGQPAPLIDRFHRLMFLLSGNRAAEVQESFENWGLGCRAGFLAADPGAPQPRRSRTPRRRKEADRSAGGATQTQSPHGGGSRRSERGADPHRLGH